MATIVKTLYEKLPSSWDFAANLSQGETITLVSVTAMNLHTGADSTAGVISTNPAPGVSGSQVTFWVEGGAAGDRHAVSIKVTTSQDQQLEGTVYLDVLGDTP